MAMNGIEQHAVLVALLGKYARKYAGETGREALLEGVRRVGIVSAAAALPFLMLGDNNITLSLIGVMFFSMTMSVTLAVLVSVLPKAPGLAFGFTTIGLFLGTAPVFFFKITGLTANCIMLCIMTVICLGCMFISIRKDGDHEPLV